MSKTRPGKYMHFVIDGEAYNLRRCKDRKRSDEYQIYQNNKFVCIFYQDARSLHDAIELAIQHVKGYELFKE